MNRLLRWGAALMFVGAGTSHFINLDFYRRIVPPGFPAPKNLVQISGASEIAGGIGLLFPRLRKAAGIGLMALLITVFPANIYMAIAPHRTPASIPFPQWARWLRLPMQCVLLLWVWKAAFDARARHQPGASGKAGWLRWNTP